MDKYDRYRKEAQLIEHHKATLNTIIPDSALVDVTDNGNKYADGVAVSCQYTRRVNPSWKSTGAWKDVRMHPRRLSWKGTTIQSTLVIWKGKNPSSLRGIITQSTSIIECELCGGRPNTSDATNGVVQRGCCVTNEWIQSRTSNTLLNPVPARVSSVIGIKRERWRLQGQSNIHIQRTIRYDCNEPTFSFEKEVQQTTNGYMGRWFHRQSIHTVKARRRDSCYCYIKSHLTYHTTA